MSKFRPQNIFYLLFLLPFSLLPGNLSTTAVNKSVLASSVRVNKPFTQETTHLHKE